MYFEITTRGDKDIAYSVARTDTDSNTITSEPLGMWCMRCAQRWAAAQGVSGRAGLPTCAKGRAVCVAWDECQLKRRVRPAPCLDESASRANSPAPPPRTPPLFTPPLEPTFGTLPPLEISPSMQSRPPRGGGETVTSLFC